MLNFECNASFEQFVLFVMVCKTSYILLHLNIYYILFFATGLVVGVNLRVAMGMYWLNLSTHTAPQRSLVLLQQHLRLLVPPMI